MRLPVLVEKREGEILTLSTCEKGTACETCVFYGQRCSGCTALHRQGFRGAFTNFNACYADSCNACTGYKVRVPAICCRSPLRDTYLTAVTKGATDFNKPDYTYEERPRLSFKNKAVFYIATGGVNTIAEGRDLAPPGAEIVAVNISRVWGRNGFFSRDLKDYLRIPAKTKLLLTTMCTDEALETAWIAEFYSDPASYQKAGIDYWMSLSFSAYPEEAHMHQLYQSYRTMFCTERSHAWFATGDHFLTGIHTDDLILEMVEKIPQMVFNTQFVGSDLEHLKFQLKILKHYHALVPARVPFWLIGTVTPTFVANVRRHCGARELYFVSSRALYLCAKGRALLPSGHDQASLLPKLELLHHNYSVFSKVVADHG